MHYKIAEYRINRDSTEQVEKAIDAFVTAIAQQEPCTVYAAYRRADGLSFIHYMAVPNAAAEEAHRVASHTECFVGMLYPNCEAPPTFTDLTLVNST